VKRLRNGDRAIIKVVKGFEFGSIKTKKPHFWSGFGGGRFVEGS
jgi:hypothetical protein